MSDTPAENGEEVIAEAFQNATTRRVRSTPAEALPQKSIEELAAEKGIGPIKSADDLRIHGITDEEADAFMAAMESTPAEALDPDLLAEVIEGMPLDPMVTLAVRIAQRYNERLRSPESDR
jgi:hypothetical protein